MRRNRRASFDNLVALRDEVVFLHHHIRESSIHHPPYLLESFQAGTHRHAEMMLESLVEEMLDSVYIVLVLEYPSEFAHHGLVLFLRHYGFLSVVGLHRAQNLSAGN